jgi:DNA-binding transcriptional LysR family regulator
MDEALRYLKYVLAAAELGSMRRVARTLGVRESTVSRNIGAFEQQLDIQIFQRHKNGIRRTDEGRDWIEGARDHYDGL